MRTLVQRFRWFFRVFYLSWRCQSWFRLSVSSFKFCTEVMIKYFQIQSFLWADNAVFSVPTLNLWSWFCCWSRWWFCAISFYSACCLGCSCYIAGLISRPDDLLNIWDFHWSSLLVGSLVSTVRALPIHLVSLSSLGCCQTHPVRLTSFFCSWS